MKYLSNIFTRILKAIAPGEATGNSKPVDKSANKPDGVIGIDPYLEPLPDPKVKHHSVLLKKRGIKVEVHLNGLKGEPLMAFQSVYEDDILKFRNSKQQTLQINFKYRKQDDKIIIDRL